MVQKHGFITDMDICHYKKMSNNQIKQILKFLGGRREKMGLPDGDIDVLLEQFREKDFTEYRRRYEWRNTITNVLFNDGTVKVFDTKTAKFDLINKWNQEEGKYQEYKIIVNSDMKILWLGLHNEKQYFISDGNNIYELKYEHKYLKLFPNIGYADEYFNNEKNDENDRLIVDYFVNADAFKYGKIRSSKSDRKKFFIVRKLKYRTEISTTDISTPDEKIGISFTLEEYFEKGFFLKGLKWNGNWKEYHGNEYITVLIDITVKNGLFCLGIENVTYPFYGSLLLDLEKTEIVEACKCKNEAA